LTAERPARATPRLRVFAAELTVQVSHALGRDGICVIEARGPFGYSPPLHVHGREDEVFYMLEGELTIRVGAAERRLAAGQAALAPIGVPHTFRVDSPAGARWLNITTHGDFERFVLAVAGATKHRRAATLAELGREERIEFVGPPLTS